jgi:hypothetical protein
LGHLGEPCRAYAALARTFAIVARLQPVAAWISVHDISPVGSPQGARSSDRHRGAWNGQSGALPAEASSHVMIVVVIVVMVVVMGVVMVVMVVVVLLGEC